MTDDSQSESDNELDLDLWDDWFSSLSRHVWQSKQKSFIYLQPCECQVIIHWWQVNIKSDLTKFSQ